MSEAPHKTFNPTWLTVVAIIVSALLSAAVTTALNSRDVDNLRLWQKDAQAWMVAMDKRVASNEQSVAVANKGAEKDMQQVKDQLSTIQQMLIGRTAPVIAPAAGRQPYP